MSAEIAKELGYTQKQYRQKIEAKLRKCILNELKLSSTLLPRFFKYDIKTENLQIEVPEKLNALCGKLEFMCSSFTTVKGNFSRNKYKILSLILVPGAEPLI